MAFVGVLLTAGTPNPSKVDAVANNKRVARFGTLLELILEVSMSIS